jgi:hypothetical protein
MLDIPRKITQNTPLLALINVRRRYDAVAVAAATLAYAGAYLNLLLGGGDSNVFFNSGSKFTSKSFGNIYIK